MSIIIYGRGDYIPENENIIRINATSKSSDPLFRKLSPFNLGPLTINPLGNEEIECKVFENAWQFSKRYEVHKTED